MISSQRSSVIWSRRWRTGVVYQDIDRPEFSRGAFENRTDIGCLPDIALDRDNLPARRRDRCDDFIRTIFIIVIADCDACAEVRENSGRGRSDS